MIIGDNRQLDNNNIRAMVKFKMLDKINQKIEKNMSIYIIDYIIRISSISLITF